MITRTMSLRARIVFYSTVTSTGCWHWMAARQKDGYGTLQVAGRKQMAHRIAYELLVGPIPDGLVIDHVCRNRACVNPAHMEPVTNEENVNRGLRSGSKPTCVNGHPYTDATTYDRPDSGKRKCRICNAAAARRSRERRRAA